MKNIIFWFDSKSIYWGFVICKHIFWLGIGEFQTWICKYHVYKKPWLSRQAFATSCVVCHTRASDMIERSESCWKCGETISEMLSLASYILEEIWKNNYISNSRKQRGNVQSSKWISLVHCRAEHMTKLWLLTKPFPSGHPGLRNDSTLEESFQVTKLTSLLYFSFSIVFPQNVLSPNPVNFIFKYLSNLPLPFKPHSLPRPSLRQF